MLKESAYETTQRVYLVEGAWRRNVGEVHGSVDAGHENADYEHDDMNSAAEQGPFIRKFIKRGQGLGVAYERIYAACRAGRTFEHIPQVLEYYSREDDTVVVMEQVEGETLQDLVYRLDPSLNLAREIFPELCDAVRELHESFDPPLIHRDLKPSNVIVTLADRSHASEAANPADRLSEAEASSLADSLANCKVTIIDFGIAREYDEAADTDTVHFGTRDFAPPEQFGYGQTSTSSDVYALGLLLFFCLTETIPTAKVRQGGFSDPRVPEELRRLIVQATSFDPALRFNSVAALKRAFESVIAGMNSEFSAYRASTSSAPKPASSATKDSPTTAAKATRNWTTTSPAAADPAIGDTLPSAADPAIGDTPPSAADPAIDEIPPSVADSNDSENAEPFQIIGRVWNVAVIGFSVFIIGYMAYFGLTNGLISPDHITYSPLGSAISFALGTVLTALLCIACLDKRRLKSRVPLFARIRAWQLWALVIFWHLITTIVRGVIT